MKQAVSLKGVLGQITSCQGCNTPGLELVHDFGPQPPVQAFRTEDQLGEPEVHYPLALRRCGTCGLLQLDYVPDPSVVFPREYPYQTGMTRILREDFRDLAEKAVDRLRLGGEALAVDIGSNDGTLLQGFRDLGVRVVGVEPTGIAEIAVRNGIPTVNAFFDDAVAEEVAAEHGRAAVVTATNVLAHVNNLYAFLRGVSTLLDDDGLFVSESHYLLDLVDKLQFDSIYHEHLRYYALAPLSSILERAGFTVVDVERVPTHGGSIRVWAAKGDAPVSDRVAALQGEEDEAGLSSPERLAEFSRRVVETKHGLLELLLGLRREGKRIIGIGAPARSSMLVNTCGLDPDLVDFIVEPAGSLKNGLFTPGSRIPIVAESRLFEAGAEVALMLSWHIADEIAPKLREQGFAGEFVVPLPEPRIMRGEAV